jgi:DNA modification methylase
MKWPADAVSRRSVASLVPYARNARTHSDAQVAQIAASITEWGWTVPILVDESGGVIAGHGRILAASKLGIKDVPVMVAEGWSDAKKRAYIIADNKLALNAGWDEEVLRVEFDALEEAGFDTDLTGFGEDEIDLLSPKEVPAEAEDVPEPPAVSTTEPGDLWILGSHRVLCGDSTKAEDVESVMAGAKADLLLTDPPYGVAYVGKTKDELTVKNDNLDEAALRIFVAAAFDGADAASRPGAYWYATVPPGPLHLVFAEDWKRRGYLRQIMVWAKDSMVLGHSEYHYQHEPILFGWKPGARHKNADRTRTTLWTCPRPKASREHPTMNPVALWCKALAEGSRNGEAVYDPFLGSGTTLIAAEQLGRKCYGIEISPQYCDVIVNRWQNATGLEAILESTGKTFAEMKGERNGR